MAKTQLVRWTHNGFHGLANLAARVPADAQAGDEVRVSARVARSLNRAVCGMATCCCGEHVCGQVAWYPPEDVWLLTVPHDGDEQRGYYAQD
jgi:hypothetical protein